MTLFLVLTFLFFVGSIIGWVIELFWRKFFAGDNPDHRWVNPGFLHGPYLPLYGLSLCLLFALTFVDVSFVPGGLAVQKAVLFVVMALCITALEYVGGLIFIKGMHIKLWDYSTLWGNIQGIICPLFSFFWWVLSAIYYFLVHPRILAWLYWFTDHLAFCLVVGFFYGVFTVDLCYTFRLAARIRAFASERQIDVRYEKLKLAIQQKNEELKEKAHFILPFRSDGRSLTESLRNAIDRLNPR
jgi:uncharacterized membrane protein